ncbi:hypothetical protein OHV87_18470, partial [Acinetobacter baumannii]|nr:hypothetical protein [Acinetobacter baumannii]
REGLMQLNLGVLIMKHPFFTFYFTIVIGYWLYCIWEYPGHYSGAYLLGRALVWPVIFIRWFF